jgi:hypothetical protein
MPQTIDFAQMEWEKQPYGRRTDDGFLQIDPFVDTSKGLKPEELGPFGLRGHPNQIWEHVEHLGYLENPQDDKFSLLYRFRPKRLDSEIRVQYFARGARFYSVQMDAEQTGYWHVLRNDSDRTIVLKITKLNKDAN